MRHLHYFIKWIFIIGCMLPALASAASFELRSTLPEESALLEGDTVAVELYMKNPTAEEIASFQATLHFDAEKLTWVNTEINEDVFGVVLPEQRAGGALTIGAGTLSSPVRSSEVVLATISWTVTSGETATTSIEIRDELENGLFVMDEAFPNNVWQKNPLPKIQLRLGDYIPPAGLTTVTDTPLVAPDGPEEIETVVTTTTETPIPTVVVPETTTTQEVLYPSAPSIATLAAPTGIRYTTQGSTVQIHWDAVTGASGYYVYYSAHRDIFLHRKQVQTPQVMFSELPTGAEYFFVVSAIQGIQEGNRSVFVPVRVGQDVVLDQSIPHVVLPTPTVTYVEPKEALKKVAKTPNSGLPIPLLLMGAGVTSSMVLLLRRKKG